MGYKETVEETVPLSSEISLSPEENHNRCIWKRLRKRNKALSITWGTSIGLYSIVLAYSYLCYFMLKDTSWSFRNSFASYTIVPSSILALFALLEFISTFNPLLSISK